MNPNVESAIPRSMLPRHQYYRSIRRKSHAPKPHVQKKSSFISNVESCSIYDFHKTPERKVEQKMIHILDINSPAKRPTDYQSPENLPEHIMELKVILIFR